MPFVRTRTSKTGAVSTALVEAYRDDAGLPRQRVLANLHGEPDALRALAKLAARRADLRKELEARIGDRPAWDEFYQVVTTRTLQGHQYAPDERRKIDQGIRLRERMIRRITEIEDEIKAIARDGAVIKKHCTATPEEIQDAIKVYQKKRYDAECLVVGMEFAKTQGLREAKAQLRRLER